MLVCPVFPKIFSKGSARRRRPGDAEARGDVVASGRKRCGHAGVAGKNQPLRCAGKDFGLLAPHQGLELIKLFAPGADPIPPDAVIEGESLEDLPTILHKCGQIEVAIIEVARLALGIARRRAKQEVRKVEPGFGTIEGKTSIEDHVWMRVDLVRENASLIS